MQPDLKAPWSSVMENSDLVSYGASYCVLTLWRIKIKARVKIKYIY